VDFAPNVTMRTVYINTYPHIAIVCTRDIEPGEELLLDYGEAYTKAFLTPKEKLPNIPAEVVRCELPMGLFDETAVSVSDDEMERSSEGEIEREEKES
jgi:SET domain